ncbi:PAS domain-containing hybrid sensor histidine kinase/response regulator [Scleromatobacter humisilvae]|uniref:Virulence sensor protein BvgS n=1 Tax=Scleromatobacter humisilvae TaxID=2897159 RepID=A0A9X2C3P6_9BURK|nr:PAS domain S-box protein [Scleromatobacter humisilvae]MCK9687875.1 PAS domain S-box protein [Scleromatobacter humisilvae]
MTLDTRPPLAGDDLIRSEERFRLLVESVRDYAIFMLDKQGHVLTWNAGAERFKGYRADEIIGSHFSRFYPPEALARGLPAEELEVAAREGSFEDEGWRVRKDGSLFWANVVITAMRDGSGELVGYAKVTRDLTQRRHHEEELRQSEERFRLMVEGVEDYAIFMLDVNGRVATWNVGAQRIKGYGVDEIIGQHFSIFYPQDAKDSGWPEHELRVAAETGRFVDTGWRLRKDGTAFWANVTITAMRDESGRLIGFAKLTRDMTQSKRVEAIETANQQREEILDAERNARMAAQRATRIKDEFLATLSHELRTPLSSILGWTQILLKGLGTSPEDQRRAIEVIDRNARAQVQLIDDLLDLSRIMTGKMRLDLQQVSMLDIVQAAVDSATPTAAAKNIKLRSLLDPSRMMVNGDAGRLQQVIWNLLTNAIKFTPKGGQVQVLLQRVNSHIELSVADNGMGIPESFIGQVFDRFSQRDSSTTRTHGGLGLGLAICRQLVELHGGIIRAASPGEGQGSTFFVELPLSIMQVETERERTHPTTEANEPDGVVLPRLDGVHAFVIDDEPDARELLTRVLADQGAVVASFDSAAAALAALRGSRPTVIVSDVGMPGMDGYQMMRTLRANEPRDSRIPALALTAFARAEDRKRSLVAGFQAHLSKPFDVAELVLLVADLVGRS